MPSSVYCCCSTLPQDRYGKSHGVRRSWPERVRPALLRSRAPCGFSFFLFWYLSVVARVVGQEGPLARDLPEAQQCVARACAHSGLLLLPSFKARQRETTRIQIEYVQDLSELLKVQVTRASSHSISLWRMSGKRPKRSHSGSRHVDGERAGAVCVSSVLGLPQTRTDAESAVGLARRTPPGHSIARPELLLDAVCSENEPNLRLRESHR